MICISSAGVILQLIIKTTRREFTMSTVMTEQRCYTVKDLQKILGLSRPVVYELLKRNEFRWIMIGGKYRISKKSFDEWLDGTADS